MNRDFLLKQLDKAKHIDEKELALEIKKTGFKCAGCAQCCKSSGGDNTVSVFPFEIRNIQKKTGLNWLEIAQPHAYNDYDSEGTLHAFGWMLRKSGDCIFLKGKECGIYDCKPMICDTYPFFIEDGRLRVCECSGLGCDIGREESLSMAQRIKDRYIREIEETVMFFDRFETLNQKFRTNMDESLKNGFCIVHTSEKSCMIKLDDLQ